MLRGLVEREKLSSSYMEPFEILEKVGPIAYLLQIFLVCTLHFMCLCFKKYIYDPSHVLQHQTMQLDENLSYQEQPVVILDRQGSYDQRKYL